MLLPIPPMVCRWLQVCLAAPGGAPGDTGVKGGVGVPGEVGVRGGLRKEKQKLVIQKVQAKIMQISY